MHVRSSAAALALTMLLAARSTTAAPQATAAQTEADDAAFQGLATQVQGAIQRKDVAALDRLMAKDFSFSLLLAGKPPLVMNRDEFLKGTESLYNLERFEIKYLAARVLGTVAVVRFQPVRQASTGSVDRSGEYAIVDTWVKDGTAWKLKFRYLARPDAGR